MSALLWTRRDPASYIDGLQHPDVRYRRYPKFTPYSDGYLPVGVRQTPSTLDRTAELGKAPRSSCAETGRPSPA
jgi:hypothetical protein